MAKSGRLKLGDNILRTLYVIGQQTLIASPLALSSEPNINIVSCPKPHKGWLQNLNSKLR